MKYSQYNTLISLTKQVSSLYNAISDKFVLIKNSVIEDINLSIEILYQQNEKLYKELVNAGAIINDNTDEYKIIKTKSREIDKNFSFFKLMINPTLDCNLKCWYCYEKNVKGSRVYPNTVENIKKYTQTIFENNKELKNFYLSFFGGEPLLGFIKTQEIISFISDLCLKNEVDFDVSFTSNGVLINEKKINFLTQICKDVSFQITLDGGKDFHDKVRCLPSKKGTYTRILKNILLLTQNKIFVILRINYTEENLPSISSILTDIQNWDDICKKHIKIDFQRVWQDNNNLLDIDYLLESFSDSGFSVTSPNHYVDFLRFPCYADCLNQVLINYNGDVYKCTARDFTTENRIGYLSETGDIVWTILTPEERIEAKIQKPLCKECSILPLCGGGCSQKCVENYFGNCTYGRDEDAKKEIVLNRFYNYFVRNHEKSTNI